MGPDMFEFDEPIRIIIPSHVRRCRVPVMTKEQKKRLEEEYATWRYVSRPRRNELAREINLPEPRIKIWLQLRRCRESYFGHRRSNKFSSSSAGFITSGPVKSKPEDLVDTELADRLKQNLLEPHMPEEPQPVPESHRDISRAEESTAGVEIKNLTL